MQDHEITCAACQMPFVFTAQEQAFYAERGFQAPKRCRRCRQARRTGKRSGSGKVRESSRRLSALAVRPTFKVHCAGCGSETQIPFPPRGDDHRAFCRTCFTARCAAPAAE